jgi:group I intron endonuclease
VKEGIIYLVTNKTNGKRYVGQTVRTLRRRWSEHKNAAVKGEMTPLHKAIRKYGHENFSVEVLADSWQPFLSTLEVFFIFLYVSHIKHQGYNVTTGGEGASGENNPHFGKFGAAHPVYGTKLTEEHKAKISAMQTGESNHFYGRTHSSETKEKMRAAKLGKKQSPEHAAKSKAAAAKRWASYKVAQAA